MVFGVSSSAGKYVSKICFVISSIFLSSCGGVGSYWARLPACSSGQS
jgi:hypothetical protein